MAKKGTFTITHHPHPVDLGRGVLSLTSAGFSNSNKFEVVAPAPSLDRYKIKWRKTTWPFNGEKARGVEIPVHLGEIGGSGDLFEYGATYRFRVFVYSVNNNNGHEKWRRIKKNQYHTFTAFVDTVVPGTGAGSGGEAEEQTDWLVPVLNQMMN